MVFVWIRYAGQIESGVVKRKSQEVIVAQKNNLFAAAAEEASGFNRCADWQDWSQENRQ